MDWIATAESRTYCPATMCPLFAAAGSPWTGEVNAECPQDHDKCGWYKGFGGDGCDGCTSAIGQVDEAEDGKPLLQLGVLRGSPVPRMEQKQPTTFDCPRAADCQWQAECSPALCPPRYALSKGIDPRTCAY